MKAIIRITFTMLFTAMATFAFADDAPTISPVATFFTPNGEEQSSDYQGSAPLRARFEANVANTNGWDAHYEWRFYTDPKRQTPYLSRFEKDTEVTFIVAGTHYVELYATFVQGRDTVEFTREHWQTADPIRVSIAESKLEMPNAFTPNGDGVNDVYRAKPGYQSLVEFKAYIFNRW